jgi:hypothetical protein
VRYHSESRAAPLRRRSVGRHKNEFFAPPRGFDSAALSARAAQKPAGSESLHRRGLDPGNTVIIKTLLGVPFDENSGELFVLFFDGPNTPDGRKHELMYHALIRSLQAIHSGD